MSTTRLPVHLVDSARRLRREATNAEALLWELLRDRQLGGWKFRRQVPMPPFILDFYCSKARLVVELDGGHHAEPAHAQADEERSRKLDLLGIRVVRLWNGEVMEETEGVMERIWGMLRG